MPKEEMEPYAGTRHCAGAAQHDKLNNRNTEPAVSVHHLHQIPEHELFDA